MTRGQVTREYEGRIRKDMRVVFVIMRALGNLSFGCEILRLLWDVFNAGRDAGAPSLVTPK